MPHYGCRCWCRWVTILGLDVLPGAGGVLAAGDSVGQLHLLDPRAATPLFSVQVGAPVVRGDAPVVRGGCTRG